MTEYMVGFTSLSCLVSETAGVRSSEEKPAGLPNNDDFDQYVTQADVDRDPFAIALFEIKPIDLGNTTLLKQMGQTLLQFASPTTHVAYLGRNRFGLLSLTDDRTQRWVAPVTTALRVALDCWWAEESAYIVASDLLSHGQVSGVDVSDLTDRPTLMTGVARGLSRDAWVKAEVALAKAYKQQIPLAEYQISDRPLRSMSDQLEEELPIQSAEPPATSSSSIQTTLLESVRPVPDTFAAGTSVDERLVVLSRRIEPVDRPEPVWYWLRLLPGLRPGPGRSAALIRLNSLSAQDQALIEVWLANQVVGLFAEASAQLRVSIPLSAEACRARSFAQRIFPLLERHRVPPSRLVVEIDMSVVSRESAMTPDGLLPASAPSVTRFVKDAAAVNVAVAITGFNGGWNAWYNIEGLPVNYLIPSPEMLCQAAQGDHGAIRSLVLMAAEADDRGLELISPDASAALSVDALTQIGFDYGEGSIYEAAESLPSKGTQPLLSR